MSNTIKFLLNQMKYIFDLLNIFGSRKYEEKRLTYSIIKDCHAIEKGLSLEYPRIGFGEKRIKQLLSNLDYYLHKKYNVEHVSIIMAIDALLSYFYFQESLGYSNINLKNRTMNMSKKVRCSNGDYGGYKHIKHEDFKQEDFEMLQKIIMTRHSIRDFSQEEVSIDELSDIIELSSYSPSACNRQPTKVYIINGEKRKLFENYLEGTGGFTDCVNKYLLVTSDMSAFSISEVNQWILNAGIFIGYLQISLHAKNIGSCVIQRPLYASKSNRNIMEKLNIPRNEQIICVIGVGKYKNEFNVPISYRFPVKSLIKEI